MTLAETRFTPGPWHADFPIVYADNGIQPHIAYLEDHQACALTDRAEANAHLIASAPELYEALLKTNELLAVLFAHGDSSGQQVLIRNANALAKARGESHAV